MARVLTFGGQWLFETFTCSFLLQFNNKACLLYAKPFEFRFTLEHGVEFREVVMPLAAYCGQNRTILVSCVRKNGKISGVDVLFQTQSGVPSLFPASLSQSFKSCTSATLDGNVTSRINGELELVKVMRTISFGDSVAVSCFTVTHGYIPCLFFHQIASVICDPLVHLIQSLMHNEDSLTWKYSFVTPTLMKEAAYHPHCVKAFREITEGAHIYFIFIALSVMQLSARFGADLFLVILCKVIRLNVSIECIQ